MRTVQMSQWDSEFGREYTDRNSLTIEGVDELYSRNYGVSRRQLNEIFLEVVPHSARILEVGCNVGNQLSLLRQMGYTELCGIELQHYALLQARTRLNDVCLVEASALEIPFANNCFDVVFTSGVLIHIAPSDLSRAMSEIHRCARQYIWGFEYYSPQEAAVNYRGNDRLLWKMDYARLYLDQFAGLELDRSERLPYLDNDNEDCMFLLKKSSRKV